MMATDFIANPLGPATRLKAQRRRPVETWLMWLIRGRTPGKHHTARLGAPLLTTARRNEWRFKLEIACLPT